jgi:hypothetical protein
LIDVGNLQSFSELITVSQTVGQREASLGAQNARPVYGELLISVESQQFATHRFRHAEHLGRKAPSALFGTIERLVTNRDHKPFNFSASADARIRR